MTLAQIATDMQTALYDSELKIRAVLDQHMPALTEIAQRVENDPLIQAAEAAALPPGARALVADFIRRLGAEFPAVQATAEPSGETGAPVPEGTELPQPGETEPAA